MAAPSKRDRQSRRRFEQNRAVQTRLKNISKTFYRALDSGNIQRATELRDEAQRAYGKAARKGIIHANKAARKTSHLDKALATGASER